jgi:hypothetical protein
MVAGHGAGGRRLDGSGSGSDDPVVPLVPAYANPGRPSMLAALRSAR